MKKFRQDTHLRRFLVIFLFVFIVAGKGVAFGQEEEFSPEVGIGGEEEKIRLVELRGVRQDQRASMIGGTGLAFTRTAILLPRKHINFYSFLNYQHFTTIQGWPSKVIEPGKRSRIVDARQDDLNLVIGANWGVQHYMEAGINFDIFLDDESSNNYELKFRDRGLAWTTLLARFRLLDIDKEGFGGVMTIYTKLPSPQQDSELTSKKLGFGGEMTGSLKMGAVWEYFEKVSFHGSFGFGAFDYFDTTGTDKPGGGGRPGLTWLAKKSHDYKANVGPLGGWPDWETEFRNRYGEDYDGRLKDAWTHEDHYTGSFAVEYKPFLHTSLGVEVFGYRMIRLKDDNFQIAPFITHTVRQIPFMKRVRKDIFTVTIAGQFGGLRGLSRSSPDKGILFGLTYHSDLKF